jgi:hypothetical protein
MPRFRAFAAILSLGLLYASTALASDPPQKSDPSKSSKPELPTDASTDDAPYRMLGLRTRAVYIPQFMFGLFQADGGKAIVSPSIGIELATRHKDFEVDTWLSYSSFSMGEVAFKSKSDPNTAYEIVSSSLKMLSFGADFLWSKPVNDQFSFVYGGGLGLGVVFGNLYRTQAYPTGDANDPSSYAKCSGPSNPNAGFCFTDNDHYNGYSESSWINGGAKPVVFPWISLPQIGMRYQPSRDYAVRLDTGLSFPGPFFVGLSGYYGLL